jgi:polyhydroxybutyrate depolymerase
MRIFLLFTFLFLTIFSFGQQTINGTLMHGGIQRSYILYIPASYSSANPAPLVVNFHGYTSNASQQMFYGDFRSISDTAGFLLVVPQGTLDGQGNTYWNANWGGSVDDVSFTEALLDDLSITYNINQDRVYSTGMSNGGFMSYYLACNLSNRIAAIASVTGAMTLGTPNTCNPQHSMPVLEIHGDADGTVSYTGTGFSESVQNGLNYWVNYNNNNSLPTFLAMPNISSTDNSTVEHYIYSNGDNCVDVEHYKVINGGHTWPGSAFNSGNGATNQDINASRLIWEFFLKYDINGKVGCVITEVENILENEAKIEIYPNPTKNQFTITFNKVIDDSYIINVTNSIGQEVKNYKPVSQSENVNLSGMSQGLYFIKVSNSEGSQIIKVVKE